MDLFTFLNQPIVVTGLTLLVGSYLLNLLSERRSRQDKLRDKAIEFITETGNNINQVYSSLFGRIRGKQTDVWRDRDLIESQGKLFVQRLSVKLKSQVYLNSGDFWRKYDTIIWELRYIINELSIVNEEEDIEKMVQRIQNRRRKLASAWPIPNEYDSDVRDLAVLDAPYGELSAWTSMVVSRTEWLLGNSLKNIFK